jgi:hypothetical protein
MVALKYYYEFRSLKNDLYRVEIYESTVQTLTPVDVGKSFSGLALEYKEQDTKFDTVIGSGATFDLLAKTTFEFIDLYTGDIKKYQVRCYRNGAIMWVGWLNTEYYQEDFSRSRNIQIDLTASDFTILERIKYLDANSQPYEGIATLYSILTTCLSKLELPFRYIYIACSTTPSNVTLAPSETTLHAESVKNRNFYDEDYKASDCKEVIESVLRPFLLTIKQVDSDLYIYDVEAIAKGLTFKKYDAQTLAYIGTETVQTNAGQIEQIGYRSDSSTFSIVPSYNREKLTFNTFKQCNLGEAKVEVTTVSELLNTEAIADVRNSLDYSYKIDYYNKAAGFSIQNVPADEKKWYHPAIITPTGAFIKNEEPLAGIMVYPNTPKTNQNKTHFELSAKLPTLMNEAGSYALKIDAQLFVSTQKNLFADKNTIDPKTKKVVQVLLPFRLYFIERVEIRGQQYGTPYNYYHYNSYTNLSLISGTGAATWEKTFSDGPQITVQSKMQFCNWGGKTSIENTWVGCKNIMYPYMYSGEYATPAFTDYCIPLPAGSYGELRFCLIQGQPITVLSDGMVYNGMGSGIDYFKMLNDIKLSIVDVQTGKEVELTDVEYTSYVNKQFKGDGDDIENTVGTNKLNFPNENGSLLEWDSVNNRYHFTRTFTKSGETAEIEMLALRTFISNYKDKTACLNLDLKSTFKPFGYLTSKYLKGSKLMISSYKQDCLNDSVEVVAVEVFEDNLSINNIEYEPN